MTIVDKHHEYDLMETSRKRTIEVVIPNGPKTAWGQCWDYKDDLKHVSFKTLTPPTLYPYDKVSSVEINLMPIYNKKFWHVTIKRI